MGGLRGIIVALASLFAVALVGVRAVTLWTEHGRAIARAEEGTGDWARILEEYARRTFQTGDLLAEEVFRYARSRGGAPALRDGPEATEFLRALSGRSSGDYIMLVDAAGLPAAVTTSFPPPSTDLSDRAWFRAHSVQGQDRHVGEAIFSRITREVLFTYTRSMLGPSGALEGVFQLAMRTGFFETMSISGGLGQEATLAMWAPDGRLIARTKLSLEQVERPCVSTVLAGHAARQPTGTFRAVTAVDGRDRIIAYRAVEDWPVIVTASVPVDSALADWWSGLWWSSGAIILLLAALAGFTLVALRLSRREEAALADLTAANAALDGRQQELSTANETLRSALADKELLLREIHHRVKNNLQVTASLLRMQSRRFADPAVRDAFAQTDERLRAIALLHETLYRSDLSGQVAVASYLRRIVDEMSSAHWIPEQGVVISVAADPVSVSLDRALPLGLVLTEVLSNAIRHAFEPGRAGRIDVTARMVGPDLEVSVRDDGRGLPQEPVAGTLGMRLIHSFVMQLGGSFTMETDGGTVFRLLVPARDGEIDPQPEAQTPEVSHAET